jgi:hypothetical protein
VLCVLCCQAAKIDECSHDIVRRTLGCSGLVRSAYRVCRLRLRTCVMIGSSAMVNMPYDHDPYDVDCGLLFIVNCIELMIVGAILNFVGFSNGFIFRSSEFASLGRF